jgi:hypothetical protein
MRATVLTGAAVWACATLAAAQDERAGHAEAIAAIRKLGGEVKVDTARPASPVTVTLTGTPSPAQCVPYLARIQNLHTCDL